MMKLSDAIRLGALLRPQAFGRLFDADERATCALGAAYEAIGELDRFLEIDADPTAASMELLEPAFKVLTAWGTGQFVTCPGPQQVQMQLGAAITTLNDHHKWTREQIADWVETLEAGDHEPVTKAASEPLSESVPYPESEPEAMSASCKGERAGFN